MKIPAVLSSSVPNSVIFYPSLAGMTDTVAAQAHLIAITGSLMRNNVPATFGMQPYTV